MKIRHTGFIVITANGDFQQVNPAIYRITGFSSVQLLLKNMRDIFFLSVPQDNHEQADLLASPLPKNRSSAI